MSPYRITPPLPTEFFNLIEQLIAAWQITSPILWTLILGVVLKQLKFIGPRFIKIANKLVFLFILPFTLFLSIAGRRMDQPIDYPLVVFGAIFTLFSVITLWFIVRRKHNLEFTGVFVQSAYRGNMGIVGLTIIVGAYGDSGLVLGGFYLGINTIIYNLCAVVLLNANRKSLILQIIKNPLIIGSLSGIIWSLLSLPQITTGAISLSEIVRFILPIALVSIGASLSWTSFRSNHSLVLIAASLKLVVLPFMAVCIALILGFSGMSLGILLMMMASPTAAVSYVMAQQMTKYGAFAAETVAVSTLVSPITMTLGLVLLARLNLWT